MKRLSWVILVAALCLNTGAFAASPLEQGIAALGNGEQAKAIKILLPLASAGDVQGQYYLGLSYEYSPDAAKWLRKAAEQGHAKAQYFLYTLYRDGMGVTKDPVEASKWVHQEHVADLTRPSTP